MPRTEYVYFEEEHSADPKRKTKHVAVKSLRTHVLLGMIEWHGPWRQYVFKPQSHTIFNVDCLNKISEHVDRMTRDHRMTWGERNRG